MESHKIIIDRPKGTVHPKFDNIIYNVDYGYLENTKSMDNGGIDVYVGSKKGKIVDCIICTVDLLKNDCEIKLLLNCTDKEKQTIYQTLNNNPNMKGILINRGTF
ncbi:MAG: inorganic pyrophosphatase [Clostridia bacterium]|nr:inorganic pyrophosphatase [Clostridia bacterium]MDE6471947.1 inorganic pyrophosphatase [Clostridia bacterium]